MTYYFDTYALVEIYKQNPSYLRYSKDVSFILHSLNILEYVYFLLKENRPASDVTKALDELSRYTVEYDSELLLKAAQMKKKFVHEKLSFVDCIGYQLALSKKVPFLTGDRMFRNKENVEFIQ